VKRAFLRLFLAVLMVAAAAATLRAGEACYIYEVCDNGWCQLLYSCGNPVNCSECYSTRTECREGCLEMYDRETQHDELNYCVQSCHLSWNECMQACGV